MYNCMYIVWTLYAHGFDTFLLCIYGYFPEMCTMHIACTIGTAALSRAQTDRADPGQAFTRAMIEVSERLTNCGCAVTLWTTVHRGSEGNEVAGEYSSGPKVLGRSQP